MLIIIISFYIVMLLLMMMMMRDEKATQKTKVNNKPERYYTTFNALENVVCLKKDFFFIAV